MEEQTQLYVSVGFDALFRGVVVLHCHRDYVSGLSVCLSVMMYTRGKLEFLRVTHTPSRHFFLFFYLVLCLFEREARVNCNASVVSPSA